MAQGDVGGLGTRTFAFANRDRALSLSQQGDAGPEDGEKEKEQIRSLQEQLAALKELTVGGDVRSTPRKGRAPGAQSQLLLAEGH